MGLVGSHETQSKHFLEQLVGNEHASRISRRNGPIDDTQVATFTWAHALRDLIQNSLPSDSGANNFTINVDPQTGTAVLRDDGKGYSLYRQFTCSTGKLESDTAAGYFGRGGTKEAPLTLALHDVVVAHRTRDWATVALAIPYPEEDVKLLEFDHVTGLPQQQGTSVHLAGLTPEMIAYLQKPEDHFLYFREKKGWRPLYSPGTGDSIISFDKGEVFIRGVKVRDYEKAFFGYNFTSIRAPIGRERDKFDEQEVRDRIMALYEKCTDHAVLDSILRAGAAETNTREREFLISKYVEFILLPHLPKEDVKNAWLDRFHALYGPEAILVNEYTEKNKRRLAHVARAQGKKPVLLNETLSRTLHKYGIPYDSDLTANYEDIMWTNGELEKIVPGRLQQVDIPLHTKGREGNDDMFNIVYAASAAQAIQDPQRTTYDLSFVVYDAARQTQVVKREDLGKFLFENTNVNCDLKNPEDPIIRDAKDLQSRLDALYRADNTKVLISAEKIAPWIQQVRVAIPCGTQKPLDPREIGEVYKERKGFPYFLTPQEALAQLADFAITKEDVMVIKAHDWIAVPTRRETLLPSGEKIVRTVFDTWRGVPDDGQYVALTDQKSICEFLCLGKKVLSVRAHKPQLLETIRRFAEIYALEEDNNGGEIFISGFLTRTENKTKTLFSYNFTEPYEGVDQYDYERYYDQYLISLIIQKTKSKEVIKKILQEASAAPRKHGTANEELAIELTHYQKYYLDEETKKVWRETFTEVFGKEAVVATDATVGHNNWLQYYCDADRSYRALAQRFGHKPIKFVPGIEQTLLDAGVVSDHTAFESGVDHTLATEFSEKTRSAYDLAVAAVGKIQEHINRNSNRKHTYEVYFFTSAKLIATGEIAKNLTYAKRLESVHDSEDITHHVYINVKEAEKITDTVSAKQYVSEVMKLALDEGTAREYAIGTITKDLESAIKVAGGYKTAWQKVLQGIGAV